MTTKLRWKRNNARNTGSAHKGSDLHDGVTVYACTAYALRYDKSPKAAWYWYCPRNVELGIRHQNTTMSRVDTEEEAKAQAKAYIDQCRKDAGW